MMSGIIVLVVVLLLTLLAGYVLGVVGHVLCLASPRVYGARTLAVVNLVLVAVHLGLTILGYALSAVGGGGVVGIMGGMGNPMFGGMDGADGASKWLATTNLVLGPVNNVLTFVGLFVFGLYVRAIGRCLRDSALAKSAKGWLIALSIVGVIGLVTAVGVMVEFKDLFANMANPQAAGPGAGGPPAAPLPGMLAVAGLSCVFGLVALILLIWYTIMLVQARNAISYRAGKP